MFDPDEWLEIGKIVAPQGLRGEMRVYPNSDFPERFLEPGERWLLHPGGDRPESVQLLGGRFLSSKGLYVIQLEGVTGRDQAELLRNARLMVSVSDRPSLEEGEYHVLDLVGLPVYHQFTGVQIGIVRDILAAGNDLLEVELLPRLSETESLQADATPVAPSAPPSPPPLASSEPSNGETTSNIASSSVRRSKAKRAAKNAAKRAAKKASNKPQRVLIPFVEEIVPTVDLQQRRIEVLPPPGLIEG